MLASEVAYVYHCRFQVSVTAQSPSGEMRRVRTTEPQAAMMSMYVSCVPACVSGIHALHLSHSFAITQASGSREIHAMEVGDEDVFGRLY